MIAVLLNRPTCVKKQIGPDDNCGCRPGNNSLFSPLVSPADIKTALTLIMKTRLFLDYLRFSFFRQEAAVSDLRI